MDSERIKEIQEETAYPQSISVYKALLKVWYECLQEYNEQSRLNDVSNRRELLIDFCSKVEETLEMYGHLAPNEAYIDEYLKGN